MDAVQDLYDFLLAEGLAGGATGWTLLRERTMDAPALDQLVVVSPDGGPSPEISAASGIGDSATRRPNVQVKTRGNPHDGDASRTKIQAIYDALNGQTGITVGSTTYQLVDPLSEPVGIGYDDKNRPEHTVSFRMLALITA